MKKLIAVVITSMLLAAAVAGPAFADQDDLLRKIEALEKQLQELKGIKQAAIEKKQTCMEAVGVEKFCSCISDKLPREASFEQYIHTAVSLHQKPGTDGMSPEQKKLADALLAVRDACVAPAAGRQP